MTNAIPAGLAEAIERLYVINLKTRPDRRRDMLAELALIGLDERSPLVEIFDAVRPASAGSFPSVGARGCFLSHLEILRGARAAGHRAILILEDDAALMPAFSARDGEALRELDNIDWALAYLGHRIAPKTMPGPDLARGKHWRALPAATGVETTHAMLVHGRAIASLIPYLERMEARPAGHADGGPMHVDGAYSWFRRDHPDLTTIVTPESYVVQRASKSDIAPATWKDRLPFLALLRRLRNRLVSTR